MQWCLWEQQGMWCPTLEDVFMSQLESHWGLRGSLGWCHWPWTPSTEATTWCANVCLEYSSLAEYHFLLFRQFVPNYSMKCHIIDVALSSFIMIDLMPHCFVTQPLAVNQRHLQKPVVNTENNLCRPRTIWHALLFKEGPCGYLKIIKIEMWIFALI